MSKYSHMSEHEVVSHIEKFGTEDERELLDKLLTGWLPFTLIERGQTE